MPQAETYGAQPPIEVLRQGIDLGLWYDRKTNLAMHLTDVQVCYANDEWMDSQIYGIFSTTFTSK